MQASMQILSSTNQWKRVCVPVFTAREIMYYSVPQKSLVSSVLQIAEFNVCLILSKLAIMSSMSDAHMCMLQDEEGG